MLFLTNKPLV